MTNTYDTQDDRDKRPSQRDDPPVVNQDAPDLARLSGSPDPFAGIMADTKKAQDALTGVYKTHARESAGIEGQTLRNMNEDRGIAMNALRAEGIGPDQLKPWDEKQKREEFYHSPVEAFGSLASIFALAASAFTHAPMENALNASAAAMNAIHANDDKAYDRAEKAWKENMDLVKKRFDMQHTMYSDAMSLMNHDLSAGEAKMRMAAVRFGDQKALAMLDAGMLPELMQLQGQRIKNIDELATVGDKMDERSYRQQYFKSLEAKNQNKDPALTMANMYTAYGVKQGTPADQLIQRKLLQDPDDTQGIVDTMEKVRRAQLAGASLTAEQGQVARELTQKYIADGEEPSVARLHALSDVEKAIHENAGGARGGGSDRNRWVNEKAKELEQQQGYPATADQKLELGKQFTETMRKKTVQEQTINEMIDNSKVNGVATMTKEEALRKLALNNKPGNFTATEIRRVAAVPPLMRHLDALEKLAPSQTGLPDSPISSLVTQYVGANTAQKQFDAALAGAKAELLEMGSGGGTLKAAQSAILARLPTIYKAGSYNKELIQQLRQDLKQQASTMVNLEEQNRKFLDPETLADYAKWGIYPTSKREIDPMYILKNAPENLSGERLMELYAIRSNFSKEEQQLILKEAIRRKNEMQQGQP